jgi:hypothetical protein
VFEKLGLKPTWLKRWITAERVPHMRAGAERGVGFTAAHVLEIGRMLPDLLGGQRGTLLQGSADGKGFRRVPTQSKGSVTCVAVAGSRVLAVGLDGLSVQSSDAGRSFQETQTADGLSLTAALFNAEGVPVLFSRRGVMPYQE